MRHAKSGWDDPALDDKQRPLNRRGIRDAPRMGQYMLSADLVPDLVLCSDAVRTRETLQLAMAGWPQPWPPVRYEAALYLAVPGALIACVQQVDRQVESCLLIAHNPGVHGLALALSGEGDRRALGELAMGFATGALAVVDMDIDDWRDVAPHIGRLRSFMYPKAL